MGETKLSDAWQCQSCSCYFPHIPEALDDDVKRCSKCVEVEVLGARLSKMEEAQTEAKKLMDDTLDRAEQNPPEHPECAGEEAWWKQRTRFAREALAGESEET